MTPEDTIKDIEEQALKGSNRAKQLPPMPQEAWCEPVVTGTVIRRGLLKDVENAVCRDRQNTYGDAEDNFATIAEFHTTYLQRRGLLLPGKKIVPEDVAAMATLMKVARAAQTPGHIDNWIDGAGYMICGGGIMKRKEQAK